jgi:rod shape-determining protein MreC
MVKGIHSITKGVEERISRLRSFLDLRDINYRLATENDALRNSINRFAEREDLTFHSFTDTLYKQQYSYITAEVINNSVNKQKNYFTLNKGRRQGVEVNMAVVSNNSIAGLIVGCSENYSVAISLLNLDFRDQNKRIFRFPYLGWS